MSGWVSRAEKPVGKPRSIVARPLPEVATPGWPVASRLKAKEPAAVGRLISSLSEGRHSPPNLKLCLPRIQLRLLTI